MKGILESRGYRVSVAYDGDAALQAATEADFDVMLIDLKLPPRNGMETYRAISDIRPDVVAIVITGYPEDMGDIAQEALQRNAYAYLQKPINIDNLISLIEGIPAKKSE